MDRAVAVHVARHHRRRRPTASAPTCCSRRPGSWWPRSCRWPAGSTADDDPWAEQRLAWAAARRHRPLRARALVPHARPAPRSVDGGQDKGRRLAVAQPLAALFDEYGAQRPALLRAWAAGRRHRRRRRPRWTTTCAGRPSSGGGCATRLGVASPAEQLDARLPTAARERPVAAGAARSGCPVFGPTRLTPDALQVLDALAEHRRRAPVAAAPLPRAVGPGRGGRPARYPSRATTRPPTAAATRCCASCGRDVRELQLRLGPGDATGTDEHLPATRPPADRCSAACSATCADDRRPPATRRSTGDRSVQVHACHGRQPAGRGAPRGAARAARGRPHPRAARRAGDVPRRRDVRAADLAGVRARRRRPDGPTPRTPATGSGSGSPTAACGRPTRCSPWSRRLLDLADARLTASQVLDLAAHARRCGAASASTTTSSSGCATGSPGRGALGPRRRRPARRTQLDGVAQNTWQAGLDRLLRRRHHGRGRTCAPSGWRCRSTTSTATTSTWPAGSPSWSTGSARSLRGAAPASSRSPRWIDALRRAVDDLTGDAAARRLAAAAGPRASSTDVADPAGDRAGTGAARLADVRALLADRLRGRPTRANFRTGHLTMCTMVPMRSVPHRVVVPARPRRRRVPAAARASTATTCWPGDPCVGERDPRSEDRQLFLDAVLAAEERLVVLYTGADERTGAAGRPRCRSGELLDAAGPHGDRRRPGRRRWSATRCSRSTRATSCRDARRARPVQLRRRVARRGAGAAGPRPPGRPSWPRRCPRRGPATGRARRPGPRSSSTRRRRSCASGWGSRSSTRTTSRADALPVELNGLEKWAVGDRLLRRGLPGRRRDRRGARRVAARRPAARRRSARQAVTTGRRRRRAPLVAADAPACAPAAPRLSTSRSTCPAARAAGRAPCPACTATGWCGSSTPTLGAKHRLRAWVQPAGPGRGARGPRLERRDRGPLQRRGPAMSSLAAPRPARRAAALAQLVAVYRRRPLRPAAAVAEDVLRLRRARRGGSPATAARLEAAIEWRRNSRAARSASSTTPSTRQVWGEGAAWTRCLVGSRTTGDLAWAVERQPTRSDSSPGSSGTRCSAAERTVGS